MEYELAIEDARIRPIAAQTKEPPMIVSDFIDQPMAAWNMQKLEEHFLYSDVEVIKNIPLSHQGQNNFWMWHFERTGMFLVRS
jgi:hypothetical protein